MISAIKAVPEKKMGFLEASKQFSVARTTLQRLVHLGEAVSRKLIIFFFVRHNFYCSVLSFIE